MEHTGYVRLYRQMLDQPWYQSPAARAVYLHLLLTVRYKPGAWRRIPLQPGQTVTSIRALSAALGLSPAAVRAGLRQLRAWGAVTLTRRPDGSIYTLCGYGALCGGPPAAPALPPAAAAPPAEAGPQPCPAAAPAVPCRRRALPGRSSGDEPAASGLAAPPAAAPRPGPAAPVSPPAATVSLSDADRVDAQFCRVLAGLAQTKGG